MTMLRLWQLVLPLSCILILQLVTESLAAAGQWTTTTAAPATIRRGGGASSPPARRPRRRGGGQAPAAAAFCYVEPPASTLTMRRRNQKTTTGLLRQGSVSAFRLLPERSNTRTCNLRLAATDNDDDKNNNKSSNNNNPLDFIFNPYESKIPKEVEADIYRAEANTPAAQNRGTRIAGYVAIAMIGVLGAFFNAFLTELRASPPQPDAVEFDLATSAFSWVLASGITQFLFLNKIGGGILLLVGAGSGLLAEAEWDSRRINAERIWEELQRRRSDAERKQANKLKRSKASQTAGGGKTTLGKKKAKRLSALSEVVVATDNDTSQKQAAADAPVAMASASLESDPEQAVTGGDDDAGKAVAAGGGGGGGLLKGIKDMYEKADAMAASQALLINKQLEDAGLLEKITDETGLKVVGRKKRAEDAATDKKDLDTAE